MLTASSARNRRRPRFSPQNTGQDLLDQIQYRIAAVLAELDDSVQVSIDDLVGSPGVPGSGSPGTLAEVYDYGTTAAAQTMTIDDLKGGTITIDGTGSTGTSFLVDGTTVIGPVGAPTADTMFGDPFTFNVVGNDSTTVVNNYVAHTSAATASGWGAYRSRGTISVPTALSAGDYIGQFTFLGYTDAWNYSACLRVVAGSGWGATGSDGPGDMVFMTSKDGTGSLASHLLEHYRISSEGINTWSLTDAATATITDLMIVDHASSGVPAAGFGSGTIYRLYDSNQTATDAARFAVAWGSATDGTEFARFQFDTMVATNLVASIVRIGDGTLAQFIPLRAGASVNLAAMTDGDVYEVISVPAHTVTYTGATTNTTGFVRGFGVSTITVTNSTTDRLTTAFGILVAPPTKGGSLSITNLYSAYIGAAADIGTVLAGSTYSAAYIPSHTITAVGADTTLTTSPGFSGVYVGTITQSGVGTIIKYAAGVYVQAAPTGVSVTNPYAIWSDAGVNRFDGTVQLGSDSGVDAVTGALTFEHASHAFHSSFSASATGTATIAYTLPTAGPSVSGYVLAATTGGVMSWVAATAIPGATTIATDSIWDALGDLVYGTGSDTASKLPGQITTTPKYLRQVGDGAASAAPVWTQIPASEIGSGAALTRVSDTNVTLTLGGTPTTALLAAASITVGWSGTLALSRGGTAANLSATGGAGQVLKQSSAGAAITVATLAASDIASGAALTRVNDTNVTLALGGAPTTALLAATSLTLGWTGTLAVARGGTGAATLAAAGIVETTRQIISGGGLTGGGDLSADRTLAVGAGTGISVAADAVSLADTAVTPGSYTFASITVDQQGRLTAASSGAAVTMYVKKLTSDHSISSTTATEVDLSVSLTAGTYTFKYWIIGQSTATGTGIRFGVNYTGTASPFVATLRYVSSDTDVASSIADDVTSLGASQMIEGQAATTEATTAPNLGTVGVMTGGANHLYTIEGIMVVSDSGDLELWHSSEVGAASVVKAGSSVVITKTA